MDALNRDLAEIFRSLRERKEKVFHVEKKGEGEWERVQTFPSERDAEVFARECQETMGGGWRVC